MRGCSWKRYWRSSGIAGAPASGRARSWRSGASGGALRPGRSPRWQWSCWRRCGERTLAVDLENPDFVRLGEAFGAQAARAGTPAALRGALEAALTADRPTLIEVPVGLPSPGA